MHFCQSSANCLVPVFDGAHFDGHRYCPYHPEAEIERYGVDHNWRKFQPGMLLDLAEQWNLDLSRSFLIGDQATDIAAAKAAGVHGYLFFRENLDTFLLDIFIENSHAAF